MNSAKSSNESSSGLGADKDKIVVLAGGRSMERDVSLRSGKACYDALKSLGKDVHLVDLVGPDSLMEVVNLAPSVVLLTTHGEGGEDGSLQGALDWLGLPYTGSSARASALCMDKYLTQMVLSNEGLPVARFCCPYEGMSYERAKEICASEALFSKPRYGGSSINTGPVEGLGHWETLADQSGQWMVEEAMTGRELTVGVIQEGKGWSVLPILELRSQNDFYDYQAKYTEGMTEFILPAPLEDGLRLEIQNLAVSAVMACGVEGYARVDFMLTENGPRILELNTLPGMTNLSDLPAMAKEAGMDFQELVLKLLDTVNDKKK
jgi:D-alanine-D-alanine ligase